MDPLRRLIGRKLEAAHASSEEVSLQFTGASASLYNRMEGDNPKLCVGSVVTDVEVAAREAMVITFSNGRKMKVSLRDADYVGPEAFCVRFDGGRIVVE